MTLAIFAAVAAATIPQCSIDSAVYALNGAPEFTAGFARQDPRRVGSDLAGGDPGARQESMPIGLFLPSGCGGPPSERP